MSAFVPRSTFTAISSGCTGISASNAIRMPPPTSIVRASGDTSSIGLVLASEDGPGDDVAGASCGFDDQGVARSAAPRSAAPRQGAGS
jgi:hypothetical protein